MNTKLLSKLTMAGIATGGILASAGVVNAATLMQLFDQDIPVTATPFPAPFEFTLPAFDPSLGTLTGVTITTTVDTTGTVSIFNNTGVDQPFTDATSAITLDVFAPTETIATTATAVEPSGIALPSPPPNDFPGQTATQVSDTVIDPADFVNYIGADLDLSFSANAGDGDYGGNAASGVFFGGSADVGGNVKITYTYDTVMESTPEPTSLLGLGLIGGLGLLAKRKKS